MAHDVFISYSSPDKAVAEAVCAALESKHIQCWFAPRNVGVGEVWVEAIVDAIDESRVFILLLSASSNSSPQVIREVERAASKDITIVPIRIDNTPTSKGMEFFISRHQWLNVQMPLLEQHLNELTRTIQQLLTQDIRLRTRQETEQVTKEKIRLEEEAARETREATERDRQQVEEARKAREAEEKARKEAERLAKEKEQREAKEKAALEAEAVAEKLRKEAEKTTKEKARLEAKIAAERLRQEAEKAKKAREAETEAEKAAEAAAKEKTQREAREAAERARQQAEEAPKEVEKAAKKIYRPVWFWVGASLLVIGLVFLIILPIINIEKFALSEEGLRAGLGVMLFLGIPPTVLGVYFLWRGLVRRRVSKLACLRIGDAFFIVGVVLPFILLLIVLYGTNGTMPVWYLMVPLLLGASISFVIPAIFCLRWGLAEGRPPLVEKLTQTRRFWARLTLLLFGLGILIVLAVLTSQAPIEGQSVGLGLMLVICPPSIILCIYYFWRGLVKNRLSKHNCFWLAGTFLSVGVVLPFVLIKILLSGTTGTAPLWYLILPPVLVASLSFIIVGIYCLRRGLIESHQP